MKCYFRHFCNKNWIKFNEPFLFSDFTSFSNTYGFPHPSKIRYKKFHISFIRMPLIYKIFRNYSNCINIQYLGSFEYVKSDTPNGKSPRCHSSVEKTPSPRLENFWNFPCNFFSLNTSDECENVEKYFKGFRNDVISKRGWLRNVFAKLDKAGLGEKARRYFCLANVSVRVRGANVSGWLE